MPLWATMVSTTKSASAAVVREGKVAAVPSSLKIKFMSNYIFSNRLRQEVANRTPAAHHFPDAGTRDVHQRRCLQEHLIPGRMLKARLPLEGPKLGMNFPLEHLSQPLTVIPGPIQHHKVAQGEKIFIILPGGNFQDGIQTEDKIEFPGWPN